MKNLLFIILLSMSSVLFAQKGVEMPLWPNGAPNSNGLTGNEQELEPNRVSNVTQPTMTIFRPEKPNGKAIIMCPGGGYARLAVDYEGRNMAPWFCSQGITYIMLKYRMPNGHCDVPLSDAEQAIRLVRQHASKWGVNPNQVGIMGASAGGHLASTLSTHYNSKETRPDFQILLYPVITMDETYTHAGSRKNLIGEKPSTDLIRTYSNELQVNNETPQAFIVLSSDDEGVPAANGVNYYLALVRNKIPASLHCYPTGGHGWGFRDHFEYKRQWTGELEKWLRDSLTF